MKTSDSLTIIAAMATTAHAQTTSGWLSGGLFSRFLDEDTNAASTVVEHDDARFLQARPMCGDVQCYIWGTCVTDDAGNDECLCLVDDGVRVNPELPGTMGEHPGVFGCVDIDECINEVGSVNVCALGAGGFCVDWDPPVKYQCGCLPGYRDRRFDSRFGAVECTDINECRDGVDGSSGIFPCSANASCSNSAGSFTCTCNDGFVGDGIDCFETDTPSPAPTDACTSDDGCINGGFGVGSFCEFNTGKCLCEAGYFSINPGFTACVFRNICTTSKNPCDGPRATCNPNVNADDFADCKCIPGFEATPGSEEGESCISSNACVAPPQCTTVADCPSNCSCTNGQCTCNPGFQCINVHVTAGSDGISQIIAPEGTDPILGISGFEQGDLFICTDDINAICGPDANPPDYVDCPNPTPAPVAAPEPLGSIAGNVSQDTDNDNLGNVPLPGVTIRLFLNGAFVRSTLTNASGNYLFTSLAFSDFYTVTETNLPGYSDVSDIDFGNPNSIAVEIGGADPDDSTGNNFVDELAAPTTLPATSPPVTPTPGAPVPVATPPTPVAPVTVTTPPTAPTPAAPVPVTPTPGAPVPVTTPPTPGAPVPVTTPPTPGAPVPVTTPPTAPVPVTPTPGAPVLVTTPPTPVAPVPVTTPPTAPVPVTPTPVAPVPVTTPPTAPVPVTSSPVTPTPVTPTPGAPVPVTTPPTPVAPVPVTTPPTAPTPAAPVPPPPTPTSLGSIAGNVSEDENNDNTGDVPIPAVTIMLLDAGGTMVAVTTTDTNGNYVFYDLPAGDYDVKETDLPGFTSVSDIDAGNGPNLIDVTIGGTANLNSTGNNFVDEGPISSPTPGLPAPIAPTPVPVAPVPVTTPPVAPVATSSPARRTLFDLEEVEPLSSIVSESSDCKCVDCEEDLVCGGLWKGDAIGGDAGYFNAIRLVVSHCRHSLDWLNEYTSGFTDKIASITVVSKCDQPIEGAPANAEIIRMRNVGRNDHTFAYWMASVDSQTLTDETAVVFLKDDLDHMHQSGTRRDLSDMLRITAENKFACGVQPGSPDNVASLSVYHESSSIGQFDLDEYTVGSYEIGDDTKFNSPFANLAGWAEHVGIDIPELVVPVCYGGIFSTTGSQITNKDQSFWAKLRDSLERGENVEEGHFAERLWAVLLSDQLKQSQITAIVQYSDGIVEDGFGYTGTLAHSTSVAES